MARTNDALDNPALLVPSGDELAQLEQVSANAAEVTSTVLRQKMELEEKKRNVTILQKALVSLLPSKIWPAILLFTKIVLNMCLEAAAGVNGTSRARDGAGHEETSGRAEERIRRHHQETPVFH